MVAPYIHLRIHSEYSLVDGLVKLKPLIKKAAEMRIPALVLTDQSNLFALVKIYKAAIAAGIKPLVGADVWVAETEEERDNPSRMTLFAKNNIGYRHLTELISKSYVEGQHHDRAILEKRWIVENSEGLLALSGAKEGEIGRALLSGKKVLSESLLKFWMDTFPDSFYLELQRTYRAGDEECLHLSIDLATRFDCPVVATNDVHFLNENEFEAHEARVCIHQGCTLDDPRRSKNYSDQQYFKSPEQMQALFSDIPEAIENTIEIAKRCNVEITLGKHSLPQYPIPDGMTMSEYFSKLSFDGLEERLKDILDSASKEYESRKQQYIERLNFELNIINQMEFPGYFLIVMDFIRWAKNNNIPVGPGRGSGAGSLVAYALKITDLDPLQYDLLFERFLNPERVSMPDFDIDFCMEGRDRVIAYVAENYGRFAVSQIITFGTMAAKGVVRDVARVQGKSYGLADKLSKMIPFEVGMTLKKAIDSEEILRQFIDQDEGAQEIWEMALKLEGVVRNTGKHAGGVVIAPTRLTDFAPLYCDEEGGGLVTQFDKGDVEDAGLVKFDFLGLRTLTIVDWALKMINAKRPEDPIDIMKIPLDDKASFSMLKRAETTAVFQLESRGMKELIKRLQPDNLEEMIALVALFRPGPLDSGMVEDFINRKHGREPVAYPHIEYQHDSLKPVLESTYGVIVYQEQVMQIAQVLAGYSLGGADLLRRAMGKKKPEEMAKQRSIFAEGAATQGVDPDLAMKIFDLVEKFAGYGFNKSHSAAYALVSYQTLWIKCHYPAEFMAAVLTADMQNTDKVVTLIDECRKMGLDIVLPDINVSKYTFTVDDSAQIVYGLGAVKGLGDGPVDSIVEARSRNGDFKNLFDFCDRVDLKKVNKRTLEALIRAGAMDKIGPERSRLMASIPEAVQRADQKSRNQIVGMDDLFGEVVPDHSEDVYAATKHIRSWSEREQLNLEKETLGLFLTGHPFHAYEKEVRLFLSNSIADLKASRTKTVLAGLVVDSRIMKTKKGQNMAFVTLDDRTARIEVSFFAEACDRCREWIQNDTVLFVEGEVKSERPFDAESETSVLKVRADNAFGIAQARARFAKKLRITLENKKDISLIKLLEEVLTPYLASREALNSYVSSPQIPNEILPASDAKLRVFVVYQNEQVEAEWVLGENWAVFPDDELLEELRFRLGDHCVEMLY